jgi:hypothetical protein
MQSPPPPRDPTKRILATIALIVCALAAFAAWQLNRSKRYLDQGIAMFQEKGKSLDAFTCIQSVISWRNECEAMASMCDNALGQMIDACLSAQDRSAYCVANHPDTSDNHSVNDMCIALGVDRKQRPEWKQCGIIIEGVRHHCRNLSSLPKPSSALPPQSSIAYGATH